jgi:hypothetical protein
MYELQPAVSGLMDLLIQGGSDAAVELSKNAVLKGATVLSKLWWDVFDKQPKAYPLADEVAKQPGNEALKEQLQTLLQQTLKEHPKLLNNINLSGDTTIGDVTADNCAIAVGQSNNSSQTIHK